MGIYFIAAGGSSKKGNRNCTLDKYWEVEDICRFLEPEERGRLNRFFPNDEEVYLWGANDKSTNQLEKVREGEYVVDVKNKEIVQVFEFCFWFKARDTKLQKYVRWDAEVLPNKRRPYMFVYFLRNPKRTHRREKQYYQDAFQLGHNQHWLVGQRYFDDFEVEAARDRKKTKSVEEFLGISNGKTHQVQTHHGGPPTATAEIVGHVEGDRPSSRSTTIEPPEWLARVVQLVKALHEDSEHLERDHEDLVGSFFEALGYRRTVDIKFQRGRIDIRIDISGKPLATVEVKADWTLSSKSKPAIEQAFTYALYAATRFVIVTNADHYCVYDQSQGYGLAERLVAEFQLTALKKSDLTMIEGMKKGVWGQDDSE